ncbi:MAG: plasmid stabilization protein [Thiolinea sp.]
MGMLTIRNIDDSLKAALRVRAAQKGWSMEEEVRRILQEALAQPTAQKNFGTRARQKVLEVSEGWDFELPARSVPRPTPDFSEE